MSSIFCKKKLPIFWELFTILRNLIAALLTVCCTRLIYHSAGVAADTLWLLVHHRLTVGLTLHWLTVRLIRILRLVWIHWLVRVHRLTVWVAVRLTIRRLTVVDDALILHNGAYYDADNADKTEQTPHTIIRVVLRLHNDYADHRRYHAAYKCINQVFLHKVIKIE